MARAKKSATPETTETQVIAYKGFDKDLKCRGYQYEVGRTYEHEGRVEACASGFHACENPMDVWGYYGPADGNRFARVTLSGELSRETSDGKIAGGKITIDAELRLPDIIAAAVKWVIDATSGKGDDPSGYSAQIGSSGDSARIGSSGYYARIEATGKDAVVACAGVGAVVKAGVNGAICIPYHDGERTRFAVGYVGEDGIEAGVFYRAEAGKLVAAS